jgi:hypothetical protein
MSDLLLEHAVKYSSAELIAACNHIPGSSYNANQEAATICSSIRSSFFTITNLTDLGFRDHQGRPLTTPITVDPTNHPTGITYFAFRATVDPSTIEPTAASRNPASPLNSGLPFLRPSSMSPTLPLTLAVTL